MSELPLQLLEKELIEIQEIIQTAEEQYLNNRIHKIPGNIESRIELFCEQLIDLPTKEAKRLGEELPGLILSLDKIAKNLKELSSTEKYKQKVSVKKANRAYGAISPQRPKF